MESDSSDSDSGVREVEVCEAGISGCIACTLLDEEDNWESHAGGRVRGLEAVRQQEESFLRKNRSLRTDPGHPSRISLAFSGGGVRAAFVATGVLWRLAECGRLKDVDYISGVSGGTYAATAFASHVVAEEAPTGNLDYWYLQVVAKLIARMQNNTPYLCRDLWQDVPPETQIGSGTFPRAFDLVQTVGVVLGTLLRAPLAITVLVILPAVEVIETLYGREMRAEFCEDVLGKASDQHAVISVFGRSTTQKQALILLVMIAVAILVSLGQSFLNQYIEKTGEVRLEKALCWMFLRSSMSVLIRLGCCCCLLSILIAGPVAWRLQRYSSIPGGTELRFCQCAHFFAEGGHCGELLYPEAVFQTHWDNLTKTQPMTCNVSAGVVRARSGDLMEDAEAWLLQRPIQNTFLPVFLLLVLMTLAAAVLLLPIIPEFFLLVFNVFVPVLLFAFTFFLVQFRVLGAITEEHYFGCALDRHVWHRLVQTGLVLAILGMFYSRFLRTFMHRYYSRSLHRAFYAKGENCTWADVRQCIYCPMLLVSATVNDYMQLGDTTPFSYMTFNQLFAGGSRLGYFLAYGQRPLARTAALSGGAIDGFIMGRKDDSMSLRFWLEGLGLFMGDFVSISRKPGEWVSLHKHAAVLVFTVVYVLLLVASYFSGPEARPGDCLAAKRFVQVAAWWALAFGVLSFFGFFKCLGWLQHSPLIRTLQQATMFYYQSPRPPRSVYISDGGVIENTGILALMQRRCRRILAVYVGEEEKGEDFGCLQKLLQTMHDENIGYLYHLQDPRKGPLHAIRECAWNEGYFLELGICYYDDRGAGNANILTVVRNKVPRGKYPVWQHLSQEEVLGTVGPEIDDAFEMQQTELGGCCCDCCHKTWCNRCMGHFPEPPTANQFLTPHMFNALCRLGRALLPVGVVARL